MHNQFLRIVSLAIFLSIALSLTFCNKKIKEEEQLSETDLKLKLQGEKLSRQHCAACHVYSGPEDLSKSTWYRILGVMEKEMEKASYHISKEDWITVQQYYHRFSPHNLPTEKEVLLNPVQNFQRTNIFDSIPGASPFVSLLEYDSVEDILYAGDLYNNIFVFRENQLIDTFKINNTPIDIEKNRKNNTLEILGIGSLKPSEEMTGQLIQVDPEGNQKILVDSMKRAVHFSRHDFNNDGEEEYLISCFGSTVGEINSGNVSLYYLENGKYREEIIKTKPGATMSKLIDWNNDGLMDFMTLFSQGDESILLFLNKGDFQFEQKTILRFSPVWGSLYFDLIDMNDDGILDIVYLNGDNGDQSPIFKNYHGIRIYLNDGKNNFTEGYFFHINGASKAIIRDFDKDGDFDIAVLAMYSNMMARAQETLVYLDGNGKLDFEPFYIEAEPTGRWLLMEAYDYDKDGDDDLVVGSNMYLNFHIPNHYKTRWRENGISYTIFENTSEKEKGFWKSIKDIF